MSKVEQFGAVVFVTVLALTSSLRLRATPVDFVPYADCAVVLAKLTRLQITSNFRDVSVEAEVPIASYRGEIPKPALGILNVLTTTDGTIGPLFAGVVISPSWQEKFRANGESWPKWADLSPSEHVLLLQEMGRLRAGSPEGAYQNFFKDRAIHGLKLKDAFEIEVPEGEALEILGKTYPPGTHTITPGATFGQIDFASPQAMWKLTEIELHLRAGKAEGLPASVISRSMRNILVSLGSNVSQHLHNPDAAPNINAVVPRSVWRWLLWPFRTYSKEREELVGLAAKLVYEENLVAELMTAYDAGTRISAKFDKPKFDKTDDEQKPIQITNFNVLSADGMHGVTNAIETLSHGRDPEKAGSRYKTSFVGPRFFPTYEKGLWGQENRWIRRDSWNPNAREFTERMLDTVQFKMQALSGAAPYPNAAELAQVKRWLAARPMVPGKFGRKPTPISIAKYAEMSHYNRSLVDLLATDSLPSPIREVLTEEGKKGFRRFTDGDQNIQFKMFLHDWSNAPFLFQHEDAAKIEALRKKILEAQVEAVKGFQEIWKKDGDYADVSELTAVTRKFLKNSGIYEEGMASFFSATAKP